MRAPVRFSMFVAPSLAACLLLLAPGIASAGAAQSAPASQASAPASPPSAPAGSPAVTKVTYVSGGSVYLEAGREQGVAIGDSAETRREGRRIAGLVIREVTSSRAVCDTFGVVSMPAAGDEVRYTARTTGDAGAAAASGALVADTGLAPARPITSASARRAWRGRVGAGFLIVEPENGNSIQQPTLDVRLDHVTGSLDLHADVRGRSTKLTTGTDGEARVYRLAAVIHDQGSSRRFMIGRQVLSAAPGAAFFDGGVAEFDRGTWTFGLFGGGAPEADNFAPSFDQVHAGGFARVTQTKGRRTNRATLGFLGSRYKGTVDRNALFLDASHFAPGRSLFVAEEVDFNPGWKQDLGDPAVSVTSTFIAGRQAFGPTVTFDAGFDNRRSVRLARDLETPENTFDDRFRQGGWSGLAWEPKRWIRVGGAGHWSAGPPHASSSYTGTLQLRSAGSADLALRLRATQVQGNSDALMEVVEGEWNRGPIGRVILRAGWENWDDANNITTTANAWQGLEVERPLGMKIYGFVYGEHRDGDGGRINQGQVGLSYLF